MVGMKQNEVTLYGKGVFGTNVWKIWSHGNQITINANGQLYHEIVPEGKQSRSISEQVQLRIDARVRSKMDSGFKLSESELNGIITNQLGLASPMLAKRIEDVKGLKIENCFAQPKLDGHRCLIGRDGAYSRRGKEINTIPEIIDQLDIPLGITLDGELYCHGQPLQTIASWAKRRQPDTKRLQYCVYDVIVEDQLDMPFNHRIAVLNEIIRDTGNVKKVETLTCKEDHNPFDYWQYYRNGGYEGAILRPANGKYEVGRRSKDLIKVKKRFDDEFHCIDVEASRDGWAILWLETENGEVFKTNAPGTYAEKEEVLRNKEKYIGKLVTCEYADWTKDGKPFHCVATGWRRDI